MCVISNNSFVNEIKQNVSCASAPYNSSDNHGAHIAPFQIRAGSSCLSSIYISCAPVSAPVLILGETVCVVVYTWLCLLPLAFHPLSFLLALPCLCPLCLMIFLFIIPIPSVLYLYLHSFGLSSPSTMELCTCSLLLNMCVQAFLHCVVHMCVPFGPLLYSSHCLSVHTHPSHACPIHVSVFIYVTPA